MALLCGLFKVGEPDSKAVALKSVSVTGSICDCTAQVTVAQEYRNVSTSPIEAIYKFPLPEGSAVVEFTCHIDGKVLTGIVQEKEQAFDTYSESIARGGGGYLLEQEAPDVFTMNVGNLLPDTECSLRVTFVSELSVSAEGAIEFCLPTTIAPKYVPPNSPDSAAIGEAVNPSAVVSHAPYKFTAEFDLRMPSAIKSVESPTHKSLLLVTRDDGDASLARIKLAQEQPLDGDFMVHIALAAPHTPRAVLEKDEATGRAAAMVVFVPEWKEDAVLSASEFLIVVDRSGSMAGSKIDQARQALLLLLRSLPVGCRFNIIGFGSSYQLLFPASKEYTSASMREATEHAEKLQANLGGTELYEPLESIFSTPADPKYPRQVFVLTDGEVSNTVQVIELVKRYSASVRLFSVGIGAGASHHLVKGIAKAGSGQAEFIADTARISPIVMKQLKRAMTPVLSSARIEWGEGFVAASGVQAPYLLPPIWQGERLQVYGLTSSKDFVWPSHVVLRIESQDGGPLSYEVPLKVSSSNHTTTKQVQRLAARSALKDLEDGSSKWHSADGSLILGKTQADVKAEMIRLSLAYGLLSKYTSYVAVEDRQGTQQTVPMQISVVPSQLPRDEANVALSHARVFSFDSRKCRVASSAAGGGQVTLQRMMACAAPPSSSSSSSSSSAISAAFGSVGKSISNLFGRSSGASSSFTAYETAAAPSRLPPPPPASYFPTSLPSKKISKKAFRGAADTGPDTSLPMPKEAQMKRGRRDRAITLSYGGEPAEQAVEEEGDEDIPSFASVPSVAKKEKTLGKKEEKEVPKRRLLERIALLQDASGLWNLVEPLAQILEVSLATLKAAMPDNYTLKSYSVSAPSLEALWATAIALSILEEKCAADKDEWELLADKGIRVLKQALTQLYVCTNGVEGPAAYTQWMASAKGVIKV